jgi:hypothetical protein
MDPARLNAFHNWYLPFGLWFASQLSLNPATLAPACTTHTCRCASKVQRAWRHARLRRHARYRLHTLYSRAAQSVGRAWRARQLRRSRRSQHLKQKEKAARRIQRMWKAYAVRWQQRSDLCVRLVNMVWCGVVWCGVMCDVAQFKRVYRYFRDLIIERQKADPIQLLKAQSLHLLLLSVHTLPSSICLLHL